MQHPPIGGSNPNFGQSRAGMRVNRFSWCFRRSSYRLRPATWRWGGCFFVVPPSPRASRPHRGEGAPAYCGGGVSAPCPWCRWPGGPCRRTGRFCGLCVRFWPSRPEVFYLGCPCLWLSRGFRTRGLLRTLPPAFWTCRLRGSSYAPNGAAVGGCARRRSRFYVCSTSTSRTWRCRRATWRYLRGRRTRCS